MTFKFELSDKPRLRAPLDLRIESVEGEQALLIRCPIGISSTPLFLNPAVVPIIQSLDGDKTLGQIGEEFISQGIRQDLIFGLLELLSEHYYLDNSSFWRANRDIRHKYSLSSRRREAFAGISYPIDRVELEQLVDGYLESGQRAPDKILRSEKLAGLIAPHIDYMRGGEAYGCAYQALKGQQHDLYIVLGIAHQYSPYLFHLARKHYESPMGPALAEFSFIDRLAMRYGKERSFADEILHKQEHSIELQIPFFRRVATCGNIVPILVGSFHQMLNTGEKPSNFEAYESFASSLAELLVAQRRQGASICFICAVDMAHIGRSFGDEGNLTPNILKAIEGRDKAYLQAVANRDKEALFAHIQEDNDRRRVCGYPAVYTMLDVMDRVGIKTKGRLLKYDQAVNYGTDCAVTFAGMGLVEV